MKIDWQSLDFSYKETNCYIRYIWRDGRWGKSQLINEPYLTIHIAATALHYGQSAFEGLKAFCCKDGKVRVFRGVDNAKRMNKTAARVLMPEIPEAMFLEAVHQIVKENMEYVPPYGTGGALYIRPLLFGSGARIGIKPADEYTFLILVIPVGDYYQGGISPVSAVIIEDFDRSAPHGTGNVKVAGNYAAGLMPGKIARDMGHPITLYLDAKHHRYIDEFGTANFIAITKDNTYVTPASPSILPSITNKTLMTLAKEEGIKVEKRPFALTEIEDCTEIGACGTAVVITPVDRIIHQGKVREIGSPGVCGPVLRRLYDKVRDIQTGDTTDTHGWLSIVG